MKALGRYNVAPRGYARPAGLVGLLILIAVTAHAHSADVTNAEWYSSLRDAAGASCCSIHDCQETDYRITRAGEIEAMTPVNEWTIVPLGKILKNTKNPTGYAVMCWQPRYGVLCFVLPSGV